MKQLNSTVGKCYLHYLYYLFFLVVFLPVLNLLFDLIAYFMSKITHDVLYERFVNNLIGFIGMLIFFLFIRSLLSKLVTVKFDSKAHVIQIDSESFDISQIKTIRQKVILGLHIIQIEMNDRQKFEYLPKSVFGIIPFGYYVPPRDQDALNLYQKAKQRQ